MASGPAKPQPAASPSPQAATAHPQLDASDPAAVWRAVLDAVGQSNAAAWMDHFRLQSIDTSTNPAVAALAPTMSFAGGAANVATGPRLQRVADTITQLLGRAVRAELAAIPKRDAAGAGGPGSRHADGNSPGSETSSPTSGGGGGASGGPVDRRDALNLPLVRDVFDVFPDASLIDARKDTKPRESDDAT